MTEDGEDELEAEEHQHITPGDHPQTINIRLSLTNGQKEEFPWMQDFTVTCILNGDNVAFAMARYIDRELIHHDFWQKMEAPSQDMSDVAFDVFDQYGYIKSKFKSHLMQRGTGLWNDELDHGPLFLIEILQVYELKLRRKGLGQKIVSLLLSKAEQYSLRVTRPDSEPSNLHALVQPGWLGGDVQIKSAGERVRDELKLKAQAHDGALQFWRTCGFRRIGASGCLVFSFNPQHRPVPLQ
jgi:hypothetical protein